MPVLIQIMMLASPVAAGIIYRLMNAAQRQAVSDLADATKKAVTDGIELGDVWLKDKYEAHVIPLLMWVGRITIAVLLLMGVAVVALPLAAPELGISDEVIAVVAITAALSAFGTMVSIVRNRPMDKSSFTLLSAPILALGGFALTAITTGAFNGSRFLVVLGIAVVLIAFAVFKVYVDLATELMGGAAELVHAMSKNWLFAKALTFSKSAKNTGRSVYPWLVSWFAGLIPVIIFPSSKMFGLCIAIGVIRHVAWMNLVDKGISISARRKNAAMMLEALLFLFIPLLVYVVFVPGGEERVNDYADWCKSTVNGSTQVSWWAILIWTLVGSISAKVLVSGLDDEEKPRIFRKMVTIRPVAIMVLCIINLVARNVSKSAHADGMPSWLTAHKPKTESTAPSHPKEPDEPSPLSGSGSLPTTKTDKKPVAPVATAKTPAPLPAPASSSNKQFDDLWKGYAKEQGYME